jgi:membrane protein
VSAGRVRATAGWVRSAAGRVRATVTPMVERIAFVIERLIAVRVVESSIVLAAQSFLALFPLIISLYALLPAGAATGLLNEMRSRLGLSGGSADAMQQMITNRDALRQNLSLVSVLIVLASATAFTRALQRVYEYAWSQPRLGFRGAWRWLVWLIGAVCYFGVVGWSIHVINDEGVTVPLSAATALLLWWWTPFLLLGGRVRWRALLPGAVLTAVAQLVTGLISAVVLPRSIRTSEANYGPIGVVFAVESWLVVVAGVLVVGAALGAALGRADSRLGRWLRGGSDWQRVRPGRHPAPADDGPDTD